MIPKAFCLMFLLAVRCGLAATNEYYSKPELKRIVDAMIKEYGGAEKLNGLEKIKAVAEAKEGDITTKLVMYEAKGKVRADITKGRVSVISFCDEQGVVSVVNGKVVPTTPDAIKNQLEAERVNGVFQAEMVDVFLNKEHQVLYRGRKKYDGREYDLIETVDVLGKKKEHYIDPKTHRRMVERKEDKSGMKAIVVEAFGEFEGVLYDKRVLFKSADGSVQGSARILEISTDFDDSVFVPPPAGVKAI